MSPCPLEPVQELFFRCAVTTELLTKRAAPFQACTWHGSIGANGHLPDHVLIDSGCVMSQMLVDVLYAVSSSPPQ